VAAGVRRPGRCVAATACQGRHATPGTSRSRRKAKGSCVLREGRHRDGRPRWGTSPRRHVRDGGTRGPGSPVELYSRIERVSLHSKVLTDGTGVTSHEETWGSARLRADRPVPMTPPTRPPRASPASLTPLLAPPAVSATATACQGRGRDGRVPFLGRQLAQAASRSPGATAHGCVPSPGRQLPRRQLQSPTNRPRSATRSASPSPAPRNAASTSNSASSSTISSVAVVPWSRRKAAIFGASSSSPRER
jgi:hypothetical protein